MAAAMSKARITASAAKNGIKLSNGKLIPWSQLCGALAAVAEIPAIKVAGIDANLPMDAVIELARRAEKL